MTFLVFEYILIMGALIALVVFISDALLRSKGYKGPVTNHFDGKKFRSLTGGQNVNVQEDRRFIAVLKWMLSRPKNPWVDAEAMKSVPPMRIEGARLVVTFINHATVLIQTAGLNVITDPVYAMRASPYESIGPKRYAEPGVNFDDLPPIDVILISHNHYDHLDIKTLRRIQERYKPIVLVPLGNKEFLEKKGINVNKELDWWDRVPVENEHTKGVSFHFVPAQHFSARAISDRDKTLWGGYVMTTPNGDIYFAGDTGYGPFLKEIKSQFPKGFRFGLLPIGAYEPDWFMGPVHVSPDEAFNIKKELNIKDAMAIHFGTFKLADDKQGVPETRIREIMSTNPTATGSFVALMNGQYVEVAE